jgi:hypothetical protein
MIQREITVIRLARLRYVPLTTDDYTPLMIEDDFTKGQIP